MEAIYSVGKQIADKKGLFTVGLSWLAEAVCAYHEGAMCELLVLSFKGRSDANNLIHELEQSGNKELAAFVERTYRSWKAALGGGDLIAAVRQPRMSKRPQLRCDAVSQNESAAVNESLTSTTWEPFASAEQFAAHAVSGSARWRIPIKQIPTAVMALNDVFQQSGISSGNLMELYNYGLMSVCPSCNGSVPGKALAMWSVMDVMGKKILLTGDSGGFERLIDGRCLNSACGSTEHDLFWCPDLNPKDLSFLRDKGIPIVRDLQRSRDHIWKPTR